MKFPIFFASLLVSLITMAQDYSSLFIPDSLVKSADVIKRNEEYVLTIKSASKYTLYEKHCYTILNPSANNYAHYVSYYDKFSNINSVSGKLFNLAGKQIKHSRKADWQDQSAYDGFSLLSDARYKEHSFYSSEYPYTVEFEEETETSGTQGFPAWLPQSRPGMAVQQSKFTIVAPADYQVRYKQLNFNTAPMITQKGAIKTYTWEVKNLSAKKYETNAPSFREITPVIYFAPSLFEVQGHEGDMSSWNSLGKFMHNLVRNRDVLPVEVKQKVKELTANAKTDREKALILYDFLQKNTRYISVQLGIGGWQPFEAGYVAEKKYGDCKALSNYMIALLKEAGITGKYVEIYGGDDPPAFQEDFSFSQFNHVIACVPFVKDTLWLECTSQTASPGYMGSFTGNRKALLIDETGGHLVHTPGYSIDQNLQKRFVKGIADENGTLNAEITSLYTGLQQDMPHSLMNNVSKEEREKYLNQMFALPTYQVLQNNYKETRALVPSVEEQLKILLSNYATSTGRRFFIAPNIFGGSTKRLSPDSTRKLEYVIEDSYRDIDSVEIQIPAGYKPEMLPKDISLHTKFGKYQASAKVIGNKIVYHRLWEQYSGRYAAKDYPEIVKYYDQVFKADRAQLVFVKPE